VSCVFCRGGEKTAYICSSCVQKLLGMPQEKLRAAYLFALEKGFMEKSEVLKTLLEEEEHVPEAGETRTDLERKRPLLSSRPARNKIRT
jgi:hypothetical protein